MTIYSIKINKREVIKTTALHEAIAIAKKALMDKIADKCSYPSSVSEKMYLNRGEGKAAYRVFATVYVKNWQGISRAKTYSNCVRMERVPDGGYNFNLHKELSNAIAERSRENEASDN